MSGQATGAAKFASDYNRALLNGIAPAPLDDPATSNSCHHMGRLIDAWFDEVAMLDRSKFLPSLCYYGDTNLLQVKLERQTSGCSICYSELISMIPRVTVQIAAPLSDCLPSEVQGAQVFPDC